MKIIKRNGVLEDFNRYKIESAILGAMEDLGHEYINKEVARRISKEVEREFHDKEMKATLIGHKDNMNPLLHYQIPINEIEDRVEEKLMGSHCKDVARQYIVYRASKAKIRMEKEALDLINDDNDSLKTENSNKNTLLIPTQRDYLAGIVCKDISRNYFSDDILKAHEEGKIHIHDMDFSPTLPMTNCCLVNLDDMLQNGTKLSDMDITKPKSFATASAIAAQVVLAVSASQYGGTTISISHLAPFVRISKEKYERNFRGLGFSGKELEKLVEFSLNKEIKDGLQTLIYNILTFANSNGQSPFVSIFLWINEKVGYEKETAMLIKELIQQRKDGFKDKNGRSVTLSFPKLLYVLDENNTYEGSEYYDITRLAAECTAKRMVPDYISAKKMRELKEGNVFGPMGCVDGDEVITYKYKNNIYVESFKRMWFMFSQIFEVKIQRNGKDKFIDLESVEIYDTKKGFVKCQRIVRNYSDKWISISFKNGRQLLCTEEHPFETENRGVVLAKDLQKTDDILVNYQQYSEKNLTMNVQKAWFLGFMLCDGCYQSNHISASIAAKDEDDIMKRWIHISKNLYGVDINIKLWERGERGTYYELMFTKTENDFLRTYIQYLTEIYGGVNKKDRHIPNVVFSWDYYSRLSFLAGMIDADGYINSTLVNNKSVVQIGSTNKELALQQLALAQTLNMPAKIYPNHYSKRNSKLIRYRVEFYPTNDLINLMACQKKKNLYKMNSIQKHTNIETTNVINMESIENKAYSYDVTTESEHFEVSGIYSHNCRSFLQPYYDDNSQPKFYGRFNQGVVTINLSYIAMESHKNLKKFWQLLDETTELCFQALMVRHTRLKNVKSDVAPILWQHGALARLKSGETIEKLLYDDYSSISLGYAGLYECIKYLIGESHTDEKGKEIAIEIMRFMNDKCEQWKQKTHIGFSIYGTPLESTTYKFARALKDKFGEVEGITDHDYITNSYHVNVREEIDAFTKLGFESVFQGLSKGGMISYVEVPAMFNNIDALLSVMEYIYENTMYAEINTKSDYCEECGYEGEIESVQDENGKYVWRCPHCGNTNLHTMRVIRRTCGYLGSNYWNQGRTEEIHDRVLHL